MSEKNKLRAVSSPPAQQAGGGGGNGSDRELYGRVSALEAHLQHLATKEDIQGVKILIEETNSKSAERETKMMRWLIGVISTAAISLIVALIRVWMA